MNFKLQGNYFNGQFHLPPLSGPQATEIMIKRECPANIEQELWSAPIDYRHIDPIIESAQIGFKKWRKISVSERINYLKKYQEEIKKIADELAYAIAIEVGKPLWEAKTEVSAIVSKVDVTIADSLKRIENQRLENILPDTEGAISFKPLGPCFVIGPFNFPCHLANGQILSALIAGNSVIFKPSEKTFYSAQLMSNAFHQAGFPSGVFNFLLGDGEAARRIVKDKSIKGVYFTGSKDVGLQILQSTYQDLGKLVCLELGGKNTTIIDQDSLNDFTIAELIKSCFWTSGQRCTSTAIVAIHKKIASEFIERFHQITKKLVIDHPTIYDDVPFMGPLVDKKSMDTYLSFMSMAKRESIEEIMRGKQLERKFQGYYVSPSIHLAKYFDSRSHFLQSEIFGPNCTFIPYQEIEEAIEIANSTEYGLACSIFSQDRTKFDLCLQEIDTGLLNWNRSTVGASSRLPFGGVKNSGNHRPAALTTIDSCVYPLSSLLLHKQDNSELSKIIGLKC